MLKDLPRYERVLEAVQHYPTVDPSAQEAFLHLLRTTDLMTLKTRDFLNRHQISQGRFTVMMLLHRPWMTKKQTPASLAEEAGVTRATMTGLIDTLERDGLVFRWNGSTDRRVTVIELTLEGEKRLEKMIPECFSIMSKVMSPLSETERKELVYLLQKIRNTAS